MVVRQKTCDVGIGEERENEVDPGQKIIMCSDVSCGKVESFFCIGACEVIETVQCEVW